MKMKLLVAFIGLMLIFGISNSAFAQSGWNEGKPTTVGYEKVAEAESFSITVSAGSYKLVSFDSDRKCDGDRVELGHHFFIDGIEDQVPGYPPQGCPGPNPPNKVWRWKDITLEKETVISFDNQEDSGTGYVWKLIQYTPTETPVPTETPFPSQTPTPTDSPIPSETPTPAETPTPVETPMPSTDTPMPYFEAPSFCEILNSKDFPEGIWSDFGGSSLKRLPNGNYEISILPTGFEGDFWLHGPGGWKKLIHKKGQVCDWGEELSTPTPTPTPEVETKITFIDTSIGEVVPMDQLVVEDYILINGNELPVVEVGPNSRGVVVVPAGTVGRYEKALLIHNDDDPGVAAGVVNVVYRGVTYGAGEAQTNGIYDPPQEVGERFQIGTCSSSYMENIFYDLIPVG